VEGGKVIVESWFTAMKQKSSLKSALAAIVNMMNGVQTKYKKHLRLAYSHFPINVTITNGGKGCEIRNFLGEKIVRKIDMLGDTKVDKSKDVKDEIYVEGTDIDLVGRSAALINQSCLVKRKDIRKFLDGIYVSSYGTTEEQKSVV
jgi:large subunit ribosomal protein L9e